MIRVAIGKELVWFDEFDPKVQTINLNDDHVVLCLRLEDEGLRIRTSKHWYKELLISKEELKKDSQYEMVYDN